MPRPDVRLGAAFALAHPHDAARVLEAAPAADAAAFLAELDPERAAPVVADMAGASAASALVALDRATAAQVLARLPPVAAARILRQHPDAGPVLEELPTPLRSAIGRLLTFPDGTAGAVADPSVLTVAADTTVGDARRSLARTPERAFLFVSVVDRGDRLVGVLDLRDLMASAAGDPVRRVMRPDPARLPGRADLRTVAADPAWLSHEALPVVDDAETLVGVLHHRVLRRLARVAAGPADVLSPFVGLAELYWTAFSRVLFGVGGATGAAPEATSHVG